MTEQFMERVLRAANQPVYWLQSPIFEPQGVVVPFMVVQTYFGLVRDREAKQTLVQRVNIGDVNAPYMGSLELQCAIGDYYDMVDAMAQISYIAANEQKAVNLKKRQV